MKGDKQHKRSQLEPAKLMQEGLGRGRGDEGRRGEYELQSGKDPGFLSVPCKLQIGAQLMHVE